MKSPHRPRTSASLLACFLCAFFLKANAQPISIQASAGYVYLPLNDWSNFASNIANASYSKINPNSYWAFSVYYSIGSNHSIYVGIERIRTSASSTTPVATVNWDFQGIPITFGYEYKLITFNETFTPVVGAGISYFISKVEGRDNVFNNTTPRKGSGFGVHLSLGLRWEFVQSLSLVPQARYRYSDGMAFTDNSNDIKVEFTGFDISTGLSWAF